MNSRFEYVLRHFRSVYSTGSAIRIGYGEKEDAPLCVRRAGTDFFLGSAPFPQQVVWREWAGAKIPFFFDKPEKEIIEEKDGKTIVNYDIIASAFYLLSGWQEIHCNAKDEFGRFPYRESIQAKLGIVDTPVVNYYFDILKTAAERAYKIRLAGNIWQGDDFVTFLSHDIDKAESAWKEGSYSEIKKGKVASPVRLIWKKVRGKDDWFNLRRIMEIESGYGAKSTFFFIAKKGKEGAYYNADYDIGSRKFSTLLREISRSGWEAGVHGSFGTHSDVERFVSDIKAIKIPVHGNRFHFLNFDRQITPAVIRRSGIKYDSTLGFAERCGFRNSYAFPFLIYDFDRNKAGEFVEIPLMVMDGSFCQPGFMDMTQEQALSKTKELIEEVRKFGGCFSLLWHNTFFSDYKYRGWREVYERILEHCSLSGSGFRTGYEVYELFRKRLDV